MSCFPCILLIMLLRHNIVTNASDCVHKNQFLRFYKIRSCYKSSMPVIAYRTISDVGSCMKFARERDGLAFNYGHPEHMNRNVGNYKNCQILGCPETKNSSTLVPDPAFDYYSAYGNFNFTENATCIKSVGLFRLVLEKHNYSQAIKYCQKLGADLANILTEVRTNTLATFLKSIKTWYKAAYVGLDDTEAENVFLTPMGDYLHCTRFRAWSPGHPRPGKQKEDCVILDVERLWRAINCKIKLAFICEYFSSAPPITNNGEIVKKNCKQVKSGGREAACLENNRLYNIFQNSSRAEQCALMNLDIENQR